MIRPAQPGDIPALARLEQECFSHPWSAGMLESEMDNAGSLLLVALEEERLVGYIGVRVVLDEGNILNVAVSPDCRRRGVASRLLEELLPRCGSLAFLTLEVRQSNRAAIALYEKFGFECVGRRKNYYADPTEDAVLMTRFGKEDER